VSLKSSIIAHQNDQQGWIQDLGRETDHDKHGVRAYNSSLGYTLHPQPGEVRRAN